MKINNSAVAFDVECGNTAATRIIAICLPLSQDAILIIILMNLCERLKSIMENYIISFVLLDENLIFFPLISGKWKTLLIVEYTMMDADM